MPFALFTKTRTESSPKVQDISHPSPTFSPPPTVHSPRILTEDEEDDLPLALYMKYYYQPAVQKPEPIVPRDKTRSETRDDMFLVPLDLAARCHNIRYRAEGFEMQKDRRRPSQNALRDGRASNRI